MSDLKITSPKNLIASMSQEMGNFLDEASLAMCDLRFWQVGVNSLAIYSLLVYNSFTECDADGLGRFILLPAIMMNRNARRIHRVGSLTLKGNNKIDTYRSLDATLRSHYNIKFDSEFDVSEHCQVAAVYMDNLMKYFVVDERISKFYLVSKPIYDKVLTGF